MSGFATLTLIAGCQPREYPPVSEGELARGLVGVNNRAFDDVAEIVPAFAGTRAASCGLRVLLTDTARAGVDLIAATYATELEMRACEGRGPHLEAQLVDFSWAELSSWYRDLGRPDVPGLGARGINILCNRLVFEVRDRRAARNVESRIRRAGIPSDAAIIGIVDTVAVKVRTNRPSCDQDLWSHGSPAPRLSDG